MEFDISADGTVSAANNDNDDEIESGMVEINGEVIPEYPEESEAANNYAFSNQVSGLLGAKVGASNMSSAQYDEDSRHFPNRAIGQSEENPKGSLADAVSPGHYIYRRFAARDAKSGYKDAFQKEARDGGNDRPNILHYKMNNPEWGLESGMVIIEEKENSWESVRIPESWMDLFGGMPEVLDEMPEEPEPEPEDSENTTLEIPDDFAEGRNKTETIQDLLTEFPVLQEVARKDAIAILQDVADASSSHTNKIYNGFMNEESDEESAGVKTYSLTLN